MNTKKNIGYIGILVCLLCVCLLLGACGLRRSSETTITQPPVPTVTVITPAPDAANVTVTEATPAPEATPEPTVLPVITPAPTPVPAETPVPTPVVTEAPAPVVTQAPASTPAPANVPVVTKNPTDESLLEGGDAWFVARYQNAKWAVWHFVSPDGQTYWEYSSKELAGKFPGLKIEGGMYSSMHVSNIPLDMNGWRVYCRYSNSAGYVDTSSATISVSAKGTVDSSKLPVVTKSPTNEAVKAGGSAWFIAKYKNATWAVWHFVSPDGQTDLSYKEAATRFASMTIVNGDKSNLQLKNIPADFNGWKVYCCYTNNFGSVNTDSATVTVTGADAAVVQTPAPQPGTATVITTDYTGTYTDSNANRADIKVTGNSSLYYVTISWANSAAERIEWSFSGTVDADGIMSYSNASKVITTFDSEGSGSFLTQYSNGTGKLIFSGNNLYWTDDMDAAGANTTFIKVS